MNLEEKNNYLKTLNAEDFRDLGALHVAYVREIDWLGGKHFAVHSADGSPLTIASTAEAALEVIHGSDMEAITLH